MEQKVFDVDNLINEIYNEFSWVFADNKKYIKLVNIIQKNINELQEENERLKTELAELKQNAIVPKFKIGDKFYYITENNKIDERLICQIKISKDFISYIDTLGVEWYCDKNDVVSSSIFTTPQEAEQLQAKLEIWNRFNKEDYIHKGEKATERDYYYYTNGASSVLENEVEQLKANQNKIAIEKLEELKVLLNILFNIKSINPEHYYDFEETKLYGFKQTLNTILTELKGDK